MKVKVTLRFRGREMAHKEYGFQKVSKFITDLAPYANPDQPPKLVGKGITAMLTPIPRNKRAPNPRQAEKDAEEAAAGGKPNSESEETDSKSDKNSDESKSSPESGFEVTPFDGLDVTTPETDQSERA